MDALSEVLQLIRLRGALFLHGEFGEPWCVNAPPAERMAPVLAPGAQRLAILHAVLEGRCWVQVPGEEPLALHAGDVAVLPTGDAHLVGSGPGHAPVQLQHVVEVQVPCIVPLRYGGAGPRSTLVCGWFAYEGDVFNPLVAALPRMFRACLRRRSCSAWLEPSLRHALREAATQQPGSAAVAARVAESLFVETVRDYVDALPPRHGGWLAGLRDPHVSRCLALMHAHPGRDWTVDLLAQAVHVSRSVLAERFATLVGVPPMQYLKRWRLALAARMLCREGIRLVRVAEAVGYESQASFTRAFKSAYGLAPGRWRTRAARPPAAAAGLQAAAGLSLAGREAAPVDSRPGRSSWS